MVAITRAMEDSQVASGDEPFVVLLDQEHAGEPDQRGVVGEDADDVGAAADLAVDALERVRGAQLAPVLGREAVEGEQVLLGLGEQLGDLGRDRRSCSITAPTRSRALSLSRRC